MKIQMHQISEMLKKLMTTLGSETTSNETTSAACGLPTEPSKNMTIVKK